MPTSPTGADPPTHTIVVLDPEPDFLDWVSRHLAAPGVEIQTFSDPNQALKYFVDHQPDLVISEFHLGGVSGMDLLRRVRQHDPNGMVILTTGFPSTSAVIESMKLGAYDFLGKESLIYELRPVVEGALKARDDMRAAPPEPSGSPTTDPSQQETIIGKSPAMQDVFKMIGRVSRSDAPVMITGESGCGKEVVAGAIHKFSPRSRADFVAINCAAIPDNLLESELFGHEKGAFTGAVARRAGRFEQCDGGTLFMDEIGDMPMQVQSKILRVLQEGEYSRVGGNDTLRTDVRILAATNKDLEKEVDEGNFREDLFYRLNVVRIHLPPLRQRREDIPLLADFFLQQIAKKKNMPRLRLSEESHELLRHYDWPGNVRELENTIQRATVMATTDVLLPKDIPLGRVPKNANLAYRVGTSSSSPDRTQPAGDDPTATKKNKPDAASDEDIQHALDTLLRAAEDDPNLKLLSWLEQEITKLALARAHDDPTKAAKILGLTPAALRKRLEKLAPA
ncbi:nitrogen regulation protein NR(I) [soil metagenome]